VRSFVLASLLRRIFLSLAFVLAADHAARASDVDSKARCKASYENAQVLRREEKLATARVQLGICRETCPGPLAQQCVAWDSEIEALIPTVRIAVRDRATGILIKDVRISIDGRLIEATSDLIQVDPGTHTFRVEATGYSPIETREETHAGEREHPINILLDAPPPTSHQQPTAPPPAPPQKSKLPSVIFGSIGGVSVGFAGALSLKGHLDKSSLKDDCAPYCSEGDVDSIRTLWWTSAGLATVGILAITAAILLWPPAHESSRSPQVR
jgi:hypothetical protein